MTKALRLGIVILSLFVGRAYGMTGGQLLQFADADSNRLILIAYLQGINDYNKTGLAPVHARYCPPAGWDLRQASEVAVQALRASPSTWHRDAAYTILPAFHYAWPCEPQ